MGEPAGIGLEITLKAYRALRETGPAFLLLDDPARVQAEAGDLSLAVINDPGEAVAAFPRALPVLPLNLPYAVTPGRPDTRNNDAVMGAIARAAALAQKGEVAGIITNPIHKATLYASGFSYPGHTEYLAALTGEPEGAVMMLAVEGLRVVPLTIHIPLAEVPGRITPDLIIRTAETMARALLRDFGIARPRIAIAGLNPHAGEDGGIGREELTLIAPAIEALRGRGIDVSGPRPADTMFHAAARAQYDAALCMYHDQALIPLKTIDFEHGVNVTIGLPIIRTSPDHGTAFDIAGRGIASPASLIAAIRLAGTMAQNRARLS